MKESWTARLNSIACVRSKHLLFVWYFLPFSSCSLSIFARFYGVQTKHFTFSKQSHHRTKWLKENIRKNLYKRWLGIRKILWKAINTCNFPDPMHSICLTVSNRFNDISKPRRNEKFSLSFSVYRSLIRNFSASVSIIFSAVQWFSVLLLWFFPLR